MNFRLYFHVARRWVFFALLPAIIIGTLAYKYQSRLHKVYQSSATLYVEAANSNSSPGVTDPYTSTILTPSYTEMITDPVITNTVFKDLQARYPASDLLDLSFSASQRTTQSTQLVTATATDIVPKVAADGANSIAKAFIKRITDLEQARFAADEKSLNAQIARAQTNIQSVTRQIAGARNNPTYVDNLRTTLAAYTTSYQTLISTYEQFKVTRDAVLNSVSIYSPATVPTSPAGPHPIKFALLAFFASLLLCATAVYGYDYFDDSFRTPEEVEKIGKAPILGAVQSFPHGLRSRLVTSARPRSNQAEAYRLIRTNVQYVDVNNPPQTILITSVSPSEGKSTTASNLAVAMADSGRTVTLVDGDLRRATQHKIFELDSVGQGFTNMLIDPDNLNGHHGQATGIANLKVVTSGPIPPNPADLLSSSRAERVLGRLKQQTDLLLIDSPPVLAVADAAILSAMTDGVIMVVDLKRTKRRELRKAIAAIEAVGGRVLGIIINRLQRSHDLYYYYYYSPYGYQYRYSSHAPVESDGTGQGAGGKLRGLLRSKS